MLNLGFFVLQKFEESHKEAVKTPNESDRRFKWDDVSLRPEVQPGWPGGPRLPILHSLQESSLAVVAMGDGASHNSKVTGFHSVPGAV